MMAGFFAAPPGGRKRSAWIVSPSAERKVTGLGVTSLSFGKSAGIRSAPRTVIFPSPFSGMIAGSGGCCAVAWMKATTFPSAGRTGVHSTPSPGVSTCILLSSRFTRAACLLSISFGSLPVFALKVRCRRSALKAMCSHIKEPGVSSCSFPPVVEIV